MFLPANALFTLNLEISLGSFCPERGYLPNPPHPPTTPAKAKQLSCIQWNVSGSYSPISKPDLYKPFYVVLNVLFSTNFQLDFNVQSHFESPTLQTQLSIAWVPEWLGGAWPLPTIDWTLCEQEINV